MRVRLTRSCPYLTHGQEYEVLGLQGVCYRLLADDATPRLFERVHFAITEPREPSFWVSYIRVNGEKYLGPKVWAHPHFFEDWFNGVEETIVSFWQDLYKLYPWTIEHHPHLPLRTRYTIYVDHIDDATDFLLVQDWLKRWREKVQVADYSTGGWEHIWEVEAPSEAIAELPEEFLCSSEWANALPFRRIQ